ncbi:ATP-binding protein [Salisediminibacterium halotolerans]|uniref:histidine kinase n=1 Tax=Salisediminibacterium halotolerans TaxID=517425 RepID=A0A1H9WRB8_9BACI|nr:ATP-binding protein [Salisediminibacterium haloalkalitolerans]SES35933.1 His Kinase A (phospho-acceptor) domain-containing protein [Salisediminibacterium haloalkalitolerans]
MFQTLRSKLFVFFVLVAFLPMIVIGIIGYYSQKEELTDQLETSLAIQTSSLQTELTHFLEERYRDTAYLAENPVLRDSDADMLEKREEMYTFLSSYDIYFDALLLTPDGEVELDTDNAMIGRDLSDREWFADTLTGDVAMSDLYYSNIIDEPVFVLGAPIYNDDDELIHVISPSFDLEEMQKRLSEYVAEHDESDLGGYGFILNEEGQVISHPETERILETNYFEEKNTSQEEIDRYAADNNTVRPVGDEVHGFEKIDNVAGFDHEWYVGIAVDEAEMFSALNDLLIRYLLIFGAVLLGLTFAVYKLSNYLVRPLQQLITKSQRYAEGHRDVYEYDEAYEEANQLNAAFDEMLVKLDQREQMDRKSTRVLASTDNGVLAIDRKTGGITLFNRMCGELFELEHTEVIGEYYDDMAKLSPNLRCFFEQTGISSMLSSSADLRAQFEVHCRFGKEERIFFISTSYLASPKHEDVNDEVLIVFNDLTEKRKMESELIRSEKLKMIGEMSAGFAHEIRNPLTTVRGMLQMMQEEAADPQQHVPLMLGEIDRVQTIMNQLMNIANLERFAEDQDEPGDVEAIIEDMLLLYETGLERRGITIETFFDRHLPLPDVSANKLKQVFMNLIQNAIEAMPDGGRLHVHTGREESSSGESDLVTVKITDNGQGMTEETVKKIGTPFFTTKEQGNGLGLATSYRIVEELGGKIDVQSVPERGTTFTITIPAAKTTVYSG